MLIKRAYDPIFCSVTDCHFCKGKIRWLSRYVKLEDYTHIYLAHLKCYVEYIFRHPDAFSGAYAWERWHRDESIIR